MERKEIIKIIFSVLILVSLLVIIGQTEAKPKEEKLLILQRRRVAFSNGLNDLLNRDRKNNSQWADQISENLKYFQALLISRSSGFRQADSENSQLKIGGFFRDLTGDGQKEWIYQETSEGASGYSNLYRVYKREGFSFRLVWSGEFSEDYTQFNQREIMVTEPIWEEGCHACINRFSQKKYSWNGQDFSLLDEKVLETLEPTLLRRSI